MFVEYGVKQVNKYGEELCGDNIEVVRKPDCTIAVLSDGLGSGVKANILSTMTKKIASTMLLEGMEIEDVVNTLVNTLPECKVRRLAYSTFTIAQVFNTGKVKLVEFDNPSTFFIHQGKVTDFKSDLLCVENKKIKVSEFDLSLGDYLVMSSDGLLHAGLGRLLSSGLGWGWDRISDYIEDSVKSDPDPSLLSNELVTIANQLDAGFSGDDTSVLVLKVRTANQVNVAAGPPLDKNDDSEFIEKFMNTDGKKIICGGTTSLMFSKSLNRKMDVILDYSVKKVPPKAEMEGFDLITEGVITISRAIDVLENINERLKPVVLIDDESFIKLNKTNVTPVINQSIKVLNKFVLYDPAEELASELLMADKIKFFVGNAVNPAHQNPDFPMEVNLKPRLIKELSEKLKALNKEVEIEIY